MSEEFDLQTVQLELMNMDDNVAGGFEEYNSVNAADFEDSGSSAYGEYAAEAYGDYSAEGYGEYGYGGIDSNLGNVGPDGTVYLSADEFEGESEELEYVDTGYEQDEDLLSARVKKSKSSKKSSESKSGTKKSSKKSKNTYEDEFELSEEDNQNLPAVSPKKNKRSKRKEAFVEEDDKILIPTKKKEANVFYDADTVVEKAEFEKIDITRSEARGTVPFRDMRDMCIQFAKINESGVSVIDTIRVLIEQTENKELREALENIYDQIKSGEDLSTAMSDCACFPFAFTIAVSAAEKNDMVAVAFRRFGDIFNREDEQKEMHNKSIFYPTLVTICALVVMIIMMLVVYPNFVGMFTELEAELPQLSRGLLAIADTFNKVWWILSIIFAMLILMFVIYKKASKADLLGAKLGANSVPMGSFRRMNVYAKFARYMNALLEVGVATKDALFVTAHSFTEYPFLTERLLDAANAAAQGATLSNALCVFEFFPIMILQMISVGEEMGDTPVMLMHIAEYYEEEARREAERRMAKREPISIIVMALVVLFLLVSMLQPVLRFYELVKQL